MSKTIRWAHLSDFHFGTDKYGEGSLAESIIEHIKSRKNGVPDLVFLTGDIAFSGHSEQYDQFNQQLYQPLTGLLGRDAAERIFIVPGNHDLDRKKHDLIARSMLQEKRLRFFDPTEEGNNQRKEIIERFDSFTYSDCNATGNAWVESKEGVFVRRVQNSEGSVGILGLNTAWHCQDNHDFGGISPGANLVKEGLNEIADCDLRVVLGHHPIEWFQEEERTSIERLFREHRVVYLHGHLHKNEAGWKGWPGNEFLTVQAGAAFQAREDGKWKNRILYAEADLLAGKLWVEPFTWSRREGWVPEGGDVFPSHYYDAGRWGLPLPSMTNGAITSTDVAQPIEPPQAPDGWHWLNANSLVEQHHSPDRVTVLAYYDGRIPSWPLVLSHDVPQRGVVAKLVSEFLDQQAAGKTAIRLLNGAGGEGKTTAAMQIAAALLNNGWQVLWRHSDVKGLPPDFVQRLPDTLGPWLIATDDADLIALDLYNNARSGLPNVHFLLAARDTDWNGGMEDVWRWGRLPGCRTEVMNGLNKEDALQIVNAWARYGEDGLGDLAKTTLENAAMMLANAAQDQEARHKHDGALLGAMLQLRKGTELREHVASLLERLDVRHIPHRQDNEKKTLRDAMAYIAAMHAQNLLFLSKPVLAKVLGCKPNKLKRDVLAPLGEEAAADNVGTFILTRHRAIAEVAIDLLQRRFHYDVEELYVEMTRAAQQIFLEQDSAFGPVAEIQNWNFISDHFFDMGHEELGIRLAMSLVDVEPTNQFLISKLAQLYRRHGHPKEAVKIFRKSEHIKDRSRAYYNEWATCEGSAENFALNIWLDGLSLSDQAERKRLQSATAPITLSGMSFACLEFFKQYPTEHAYIMGCGAAAKLGIALNPTGISKNHLYDNWQAAVENGVPDLSLIDSLEVVKSTISLAWQRREADLPDWLPDQEQLEFTQLTDLLRLSS